MVAMVTVKKNLHPHSFALMKRDPIQFQLFISAIRPFWDFICLDRLDHIKTYIHMHIYINKNATVHSIIKKNTTPSLLTVLKVIFMFFAQIFPKLECFV